MKESSSALPMLESGEDAMGRFLRPEELELASSVERKVEQRVLVLAVSSSFFLSAFDVGETLVWEGRR